MELKMDTMESFDENKYNRAKERVKKEKDFYSHLIVYLVINSLLILMHLGLFRNGFFDWDYPGWTLFTTPFFWGIGLFFHGLHVFQNKIKLFRNWEERKIKEFMEKEEEDFKNTTKYN